MISCGRLESQLFALDLLKHGGHCFAPLLNKQIANKDKQDVDTWLPQPRDRTL